MIYYIYLHIYSSIRHRDFATKHDFCCQFAGLFRGDGSDPVQGADGLGFLAQGGDPREVGTNIAKEYQSHGEF